MFDTTGQLRTDAFAAATPIDVSIVMPCLNEADSLPHCVANAQAALALMAARHGLAGEVVVADNGSTDGSRALAEALGARVVPVAERGYGAAIAGGCRGAFGRFLLIGDADGSYDFTDGVAMVGKLLAGADLCMGSRFQGGIAPGAMPWKNRWIGNPALTGLLNLFFRSGIDDAHCGLRAITRDALDALRLTGAGMEFASEMVVKASLRGFAIAQVPATLSPDLRDRPPHLRPWRDGWRHLRFLLMLSPGWTFGAPAIAGGAAAAMLFALALLHALVPGAAASVGPYWVIAAGALATTAHLSGLMAMAAKFHGVRAGYRRPGRTRRVAGWLSLETMLACAAAECAAGLLILAGVLVAWADRAYGPAASVLAPVAGTTLVTLGAQTALAGFLLGILGDNQARFVPQGGAA